MTPASLTAVARHFAFVRETEGANAGAWVQFFQRFTGGRVGDSWCADFVSVVLDVAFFGAAPLRRTGSTPTMLADARAHGFIVAAPQPEDLYFFVRADGTPHHVGIVTAATPLIGIAGNTSPDGISSNGTGVFEHPLMAAPSGLVFVRLKPA